MIGIQKTEVGLTEEQAFEIGLLALKRKIYTQASAWLLAVFAMIEGNSESSLDQEAVINAINMLTLEVFYETGTD